jgi:hypothetical protein
MNSVSGRIERTTSASAAIFPPRVRQRDVPVGGTTQPRAISSQVESRDHDGHEQGKWDDIKTEPLYRDERQLLSQ